MMYDDGFGPIAPLKRHICYISHSSSKSAPVVNQPGLDALNANISRASNVAQLPFEAYGGQMTAPLSANEQMASNAAPGAFFAGAPALNQAQSAAGGLAGYNAPNINRADVRDVAPGDLLSGIAKYQNPYNADVVNATLGDLSRARDMQRVSDQQHTPMGAFGGSRQGVADSLTNEAYLRTAANTAAGLRQSGFDTAAGLAQGDASRALAAQQGNQGADLSIAGQNANLGLQGAGVRQAGASLLGDIGNSQNSNFLSAVGALGATGQNERNVNQSANDAAYQEFMRWVNKPYQDQQLINQSLGLVPASLGTQAKGSGFGFQSPISLTEGSGFGFQSPISLTGSI